MKNLLIIMFFVFQFSCSTVGQPKLLEQIKVERKPFQKSEHVINQPSNRSQQELTAGGDRDAKSKVVVVDEKAGKYEFRWIGRDGKEKIVAYQRHDAIEGVIESRVEKSENGSFRYKYLIKLFPSSPTRLLNFSIYTLTTKVEPIKQDRVFSNFRHPLVDVKDNYQWLSYYPEHENGLIVKPGDTLEVSLESPNPPGVVKSWVSGGELATKGVGEDLPPELESKIPIFQDFATCLAIGPVESLSSMSKPEKVKYLLENLSKFIEAGWMSEGTAKNYEVILQAGDFPELLKKAKKDVEYQYITNEVFQIIDELNK